MSPSIKDQSLSLSLKRFLLVQLLIGYIILVSGLLVNLLQFLSTCFIWPFNRALYRKINNHLATIIWSQMTFLYQWWSNSDLIVYIKPEDLQKMSQENAIWLPNHRYDIDWLVGWVLAQRLGLLGGSKIFGKQSLRAIPVIGWCWYFTESIFLRRVWNTDKAALEHDIQRLVDDYPNNYYFNFLFACEGTRYSNEKRLESMKVAEEKGLQKLQHHILPRTKGFVLLMKGIHKHITGIYDITLVFQTPKYPQLSNLLIGHQCQAECFIRRIPVSEIPCNDEEKSAQFIHKLFQEKDKIFEYFVQHGTFDGAGNPRANLKRNKKDLIIEFICFIVIGLPSIYFFIKFLLSASLFSQIIFLCIVLAGAFGGRAMIQTASRSKQE